MAYPPARCLACDSEIDVGGERIIVTTALNGRQVASAQPLVWKGSIMLASSKTLIIVR